VSCLLSTRVPRHPLFTLFPYTTLFRSPSLSELFGFYLYNAQDGYDYIGYSSLEKEKALAGSLYYANQCHNWSYQAGAEIRQVNRSEEHTSELQSRENLVCRLLLEKKNQ